MSQLFKLTFNEPIRIGDDVYSPGYTFTAPAEQFFGPHSKRELAPLNLFKEGLFEEIVRGYYRIPRDFTLEVGSVTLRKGNRFYGLPVDAGGVGIITFLKDPIGDYTMDIAGVSVQAENTAMDIYDTIQADLYFTESGEPVEVEGLLLKATDEKGHYTVQVSAAAFGSKPGSFSLDVNFRTKEGLQYTYPLMVTVRTPGVTVNQKTTMLLASQDGQLDFSISIFDKFPQATLVSASMDRGGSVGELISKGNGEFSLMVKSGATEGNSKISAVFDVGGWTFKHDFTVSIISKDASVTVPGGNLLDINLTQLLKIKIILDGKPVTNLTTKSLVISGSKSYNTYTKKLVKVDEAGTWQWSVYTNSTQGPVYFDIVITVDGLDYTLPRQTFTVRAL